MPIHKQHCFYKSNYILYLLPEAPSAALQPPPNIRGEKCVKFTARWRLNKLGAGRDCYCIYYTYTKLVYQGNDRCTRV